LAPPPTRQEAASSRASKRFDPGRLWAYARRETMELLLAIYASATGASTEATNLSMVSSTRTVPTCRAA
jgi:hypothetical protein